MKTHYKSHKKYDIDYFLVLIVVFFGARANLIAAHDASLIIAFLFNFYIFYKRDGKVDLTFMVFIIVYTFITMLYYFKFGSLDAFRAIREYIRFFYAYLVFRIVGYKFFTYYEDILYKLALISLPLYIIQLIDYNFLKSFVDLLPFLNHRGEWYHNIIIFTLNDNGPERNSGFAWEAKGFGSLLVMAMIFNLILYKFNLFNKRFMVMFIAAITTLSTTTILVILSVILPLYMLNKNTLFKFLATPIFIVISLFIFVSAPILKDKIIHEINIQDEFLRYVYDKNIHQEGKSMGRTGSLLLDYLDFIKEPLIGYGENKNKRTMYGASGVKLIRVNGFSDLMAKYGIIGLVYWFWALLYASLMMGKYYKFKGSPLIVLAIFEISFGSAVVFHPLFLIYPFMWMSMRTKHKKIPNNITLPLKTVMSPKNLQYT